MKILITGGSGLVGYGLKQIITNNDDNDIDASHHITIITYTCIFRYIGSTVCAHPPLEPIVNTNHHHNDDYCYQASSSSK